jgi:hypothetical protein
MSGVCRFLGWRHSMSPIVLEYAKWVISSKTSDDLQVLQPIFARIGLDGPKLKEAIESFCSASSSNNKPALVLNQVR